MALTAATVRHGALEPGMDARALNIAQSRLIFNPSPEADSLVEVAVECGVYRSLRPLLLDFSASNRAEGDLECAITMWADSLVTDLRDRELNGRSALGTKAIARALREPLRTLTSPQPDSTATAEAIRALVPVLSRQPRAQLTAPAVRRELGEAKFRKLLEVLP